MSTYEQILEQRGMPAAMESEIAVLGAMLLDAMAISDATSELSSEDFSIDAHRKVFRAIAGMMDAGQAVDHITVMEALQRRKELDAVGGPAYLAFLSEGIPYKLNIKSYVRAVKDKSLLRTIMRMANSILTRAADQSEDATAILADLQEQTFEVQAEDAADGPVEVGEVVTKVVEAVLEERSRGSADKPLGYTFGVRGVDFRTGGMRKGEYTIIAADAGAGKTAYAVQVTVDNGLQKVPSLWFSLEMTKAQLVRRMFATASAVSGPYGPRMTAAQMRNPWTIAEGDKYSLYQVGDRVAGLPIWIDDDAALSLPKLIARARLAIRRHKVELIFVDYLQLVHVDDPKLNETQRLDRVTFALRDLAKTENVHVVALSQFSYAEDGGRRRLKGSSSLRQSCQNLLLLEQEEEDGVYTGKAIIRIDKQREGSKAKIDCGFDQELLRFIDKQI